MGQKLIDNIETNDMNFKHLETTKDIIISPKNEYGDPQRPDASHTWSAKVSNGVNYVGDYAVKIDGTSLIVDSSDFTKLPAGNYQLEVWEQWNDADGTSELSIYPSPRQTIPFTIYANVPDQAEEEIKRIGFQDVVDQAVMNIGMNYVFKVNTIEPDQTATVVQTAADGKNYVTFNIPRGAKGDTGTVDNAGLAAAPAFVNLQTQVDNKINDITRNGGGRNLIANTGTDIVIDATSDNANNYSFASLGFIEQPKQGDLITVSAEGTLTGTGALDEYQVALYNWSTTNPRSQAQYLKAGKRDSVTLSLDNLNGAGDTVLLIYAGKSGETKGKKNIIHHLMIEKGIVAHDWQPAPEDAPSNDSQLVHKTGNETIAGDKALVGNTTLAATTILAGNYGLRVTTSGIQKTTDGKTWVPANI